MGYIIGTDEAGYGPNLGPLIISATVWEAPDDVGGEELFALLQEVVGSVSFGSAGASPSRKKSQVGKLPHENGLPVFADSKILYTPGKGLANLERGLWAAWSLLGWELTTWREVWERLAPGALEVIDGCPFYCDFNRTLPRDFSPTVEAASCRIAQEEASCRIVQEGDTESTPKSGKMPLLQEKFAATGVKLLAVRSRAVFPQEFNRLMEEHDSKGAALSYLTLSLVAELMQPLEKGPISVLCDKHGGRDYYAALLVEHFYDGFVEVHGEGRAQSTYRYGPPERRVEFCFRAKAESCLPAALASMVSKYLRELAMEAFNAYWTARVPNLSITAGYPLDAGRFRADIAAAQLKLGIDDAVLWRKK